MQRFIIKISPTSDGDQDLYISILGTNLATIQEQAITAEDIVLSVDSASEKIFTPNILGLIQTSITKITQRKSATIKATHGYHIFKKTPQVSDTLTNRIYGHLSELHEYNQTLPGAGTANLFIIPFGLRRMLYIWCVPSGAGTLKLTHGSGAYPILPEQIHLDSEQLSVRAYIFSEKHQAISEANEALLMSEWVADVDMADAETIPFSFLQSQPLKRKRKTHSKINYLTRWITISCLLLAFGSLLLADRLSASLSNQRAIIKARQEVLIAIRKDINKKRSSYPVAYARTYEGDAWQLAGSVLEQLSQNFIVNQFSWKIEAQQLLIDAELQGKNLNSALEVIEFSKQVETKTPPQCASEQHQSIKNAGTTVIQLSIDLHCKLNKYI